MSNLRPIFRPSGDQTTKPPPNRPTPQPNNDHTTEYDFLRDTILSAATFDYANYLAQKWQSPLHEVLITLGWLSETIYVHALAKHLNIKLVPESTAEDSAPSGNLLLPMSNPSSKITNEPALGLMILNGKRLIVLNGRAVSPAKMADIIKVSGYKKEDIAIATQTTMRQAERRQNQPQNIDRAVNHLINAAPTLSSSSGLWPSQALTMAMLTGLLAGALAVAPRATLLFILALLTLPFLIVVILRLSTIFVIFFNNPDKNTKHPTPNPIPDSELPDYSILVPLYKEHEVLPDLVEALKALDYPTTKLDIKIILESVDLETIKIAKSINMPGNFDIIIVPEGGPRTKPKALNYALEYAHGEYVVIYDAEDEPEPDQLRRALELFRRSGPDTACIQARLNIYNSRETWLTRQFTIEYTSLFDGLLPAFQSLSLPILLGGTSNHFRTSILRQIGAWDPYNVTEDADLGIRIIRRGYKCHILPSTTYEEAPTRFIPWLKQRTRWLKGWLQTYLVHTRNTASLRRDIGTWQYIGFQAILGGAILSALIHPLFYLGFLVEYFSGSAMIKPTSLFGNALWHAALINLSCGYLAAIALAWVTLIRRGLPTFLLHTLFMPLYWLFISLAAYRALFQIIWQPFLWEKTTHTRSVYRKHKA